MTAAPAPPRATPRPPRRSAWRWAFVLLLLIAIAGAAFWWWREHGRDDPLAAYQLATVQRADLEDLVTATGTVQPRDYVDVGAQVSGQLRKIHVEVGSVVKQGDLLAEIDPTVYLANVDARRAGLRNLRATMLDREAQLTLAELQYTRQKNLMAEEATTTESLQQAEATMRSAKAQIAALKAQIEQSESSLRGDEANLSYAKIFAPMAGTVVSITARQGQTLNTNQSAPVILRVADLSTMTVQTQVSEADVSKLRLGMEAYFTTLGSQGRRWYGALRKIEPTPTVTNNVVLYNALFDVPNANQSLMTNMTAQVFFVAASVRDALVIPAAAVPPTPRGPGGRDGGGSGRSGAAGAASAAGTSSAASASEPASSSAPSASSASPAASGSAASLAAMSPDERRAAFAAMTPAQRQALRDRRRAEGGGATGAAQGPRRATVQVATPDGRIESREVTLGTSNRVQVQVLDGLQEGERVVAGLKPPPSTAPGARSGLQQGPGGMPPGVGGAPAGVGRR